MIDNCASLLPNVVHSYLPISSLKVELFALYFGTQSFKKTNTTSNSLRVYRQI